ncbi:MAG TPA: DUF1127 domain-containing protein [Alphaproteobacteria bacterium]|nr:DUF1127 domain-containing protein [Alphaproteobacteria bacterium]
MIIEILPAPQSKFAAHGAALLQSIFALLSDWRWRRRTRRQLAQLDANGLKDIGLSECDRWRECAKPFWHA